MASRNFCPNPREKAIAHAVGLAERLGEARVRYFFGANSKVCHHGMGNQDDDDDDDDDDYNCCHYYSCCY